MACILATGIVTLDIINEVASYPEEDAEVRALSQRIRRGGNASNTLCVLSQLGHQSYLASTLINEADGQVIETDLNRYQINIQFCPRLNEGKMPTSYITLNRQNGSRTIVHHRDCPELSYAAFQHIDLSLFDWLHFEGRNIAELQKILKHCRQKAPNLPISLEIEKPREDIESLFYWADWLFFSSHYAKARGFQSAEDMLASLPVNYQATLTWGAEGAYGWHNGKVMFVPATKNNHVVDSLGAGDTFNAGMIHSLVAENSLQNSLQFASQLAAEKCQQYGFENLV
ncbi:PfkB family carbohydrate kinase [Methylophaga nitratireducenticrescens]|uniref:Ketohexokinase n=1 Tax=Methylophaga nitratireducenticrescens TaxID=754476 RepID=I1XMZ2_METNJ|nr:PfkB family carbohydrate kinase [Methylophaga nitratireducenticrescens]AFI85761.1 ketohexokinase [Methylophaga nitratireducenticrescens]AUZ85486.1 ketohexokinase [Methylophaga nitratireducenticrescens]